MRTDPLELPLLCFSWGGVYLDISVPFGLRHGARNMQSISMAFPDILRSEGIETLAYIDDIVGWAPDRKKAESDFRRATELMKELGLTEAIDNRNVPSKNIIWLGILFDTVKGTMSIPDDKLKECLVLATEWQFKNKRQRPNYSLYWGSTSTLPHVALPCACS